MIPYLGAISRPNALNLANLKIGELASNLSRLMHSLVQPPIQPSFYCGVSYPLSRPKLRTGGVSILRIFGVLWQIKKKRSKLPSFRKRRQ